MKTYSLEEVTDKIMGEVGTERRDEFEKRVEQGIRFDLEFEDFTISELQKRIHQNAKDKGFYDNPNQNFGEKCMLIVSQVSEALEAHRKNHRADLQRFKTPYEGDGELTRASWQRIRFECDVKDSVEDELADSLIRMLDLAGWMGIDLERHVLLKMEYNSGRERLHGKQY